MRKFILLGWALAVVWIYIGTLVNFHQHRIWGKQLIPVAAYSTRAKEKDGLFSAKSDTDSGISLSGVDLDFSTPQQMISDFYFPGFRTIYIFLPALPVLQQDFEALSLRGPPTV